MKKVIINSCIAVLVLIGFYCQKELSVSPEDPVIHTGLIYIKSNPTNAKIFLNDKNTGKTTPDSLRWLEAGKYKLTLKLNDWADSVFFVTIDEIKKDSVLIDFTMNSSMSGTLDVKTLPAGAEIF